MSLAPKLKYLFVKKSYPVLTDFKPNVPNPLQMRRVLAICALLLIAQFSFFVNLILPSQVKLPQTKPNGSRYGTTKSEVFAQTVSRLD